MRLFPLNGARGFGGEVEADAVDAGDLFGDAVGDVLQQGKGHVLDRGGHGVAGVDGAQDDRPLERAFAVLDADRLEVGDDREILPDLALQAVFGELFAQDGVGFPHSLEAVARDGAEAAHAQAGAGERLTVDHRIRQAQRRADDAHFVLEQQAQRLHQLKLQIVRQAADVVVGLDAVALEDVRVNGALGQELDVLLLAGFLLEHTDELGADDLALALRLLHTGQLVQEAVDGVHIDEVGVHLVAEHLHDLFRLALAQQAVVDMYADELLADGFDEQRRHHRGIHAAGQRQQNLFVADLRPDGGNLFVDERLRQFGRSDADHIVRSFVHIHGYRSFAFFPRRRAAALLYLYTV